MSVRVAINGFGRIGRNVLRAIVEGGRKDIEVVAINDLGPVETNAHLLRFDLRAWPLPRRGHGQGRHHRLRQRRDQGDRRSRTRRSCRGRSSASTSRWNAPASSPRRRRLRRTLLPAPSAC